MFARLNRKKSQDCRQRSRQASFRPRLETLEDRCVPTVGMLDPTFGSGGVAATSVGIKHSYANAVVVQPDGKIIAAGYASGSQTGQDFALVRYNPDGSRDTSFGTNGVVTTDFSKRDDRIEAVALLPDGKILVAGGSQSYKSFKWDNQVVLARYLPNGALDTSFGKLGTVMTSFGSAAKNASSQGARASTLAIQGDGRIVVGGWAINASSGQDFLLARYTASGSLDKTFGTGGSVTTDILGSADHVYKMVIQGDGKLVVVGDGTYKLTLARYSPTGSLDPTFGSGGVVTSSLMIVGSDLALTANGKLVVAGVYWHDGGDGTYGARTAVARFNANGSTDAGFGQGGLTVMAVGEYGNAPHLVIDAVGRIVVAADTFGPSDSNGKINFDFAVGRLNADGSPDLSFGTGGIIRVDTPGTSEWFTAVALQADGRIVACGYAQDPTTGNNRFAVARFLMSAPEIGSFVASSNTVTSGGHLTLTASNLTDGNPSAAVTQVEFYYFDIDGNRQSLGFATQTGSDVWELTFVVYLPPGVFTLFAEATDNYGAVGDPLSLSLQVL